VAASGAPTLDFLAPAKVNLYLRVLGRRDDGYHLLESLVVFVDLADRLSFTLAPVLRATVQGPFAAALGGGENLVERAARLLLQAMPPAEPGCAQPGAAIALEKNIPVAAGLGGGSADAAATLDALNRLWQLGLDQSQLDGLAIRLGADVAVCRFGRPAFVSGIGEHIAPAPLLPELALLLVNPNRAVATKDVFARLTPPFSTAEPMGPMPATAAALADLLRRRGNQLTTAALGLCAEIGDALALLAQTQDCLLAQMSGSGATCFGLYADLPQARQAERQLRERRPHWFARACRVLR
jgi:4-diphosphocytidyl-2-C-methyl-D-erythritol kinase